MFDSLPRSLRHASRLRAVALPTPPKLHGYEGRVSAQARPPRDVFLQPAGISYETSRKAFSSCGTSCFHTHNHTRKLLGI